MSWDHVIIGRPKIMNCYCTGLENNYGTYNYSTCVPQPAPCFNSYHLNEPWGGVNLETKRQIWTYAPERQAFEMIFEYCNNNNLDINESVKPSCFSWEIKRINN